MTDKIKSLFGLKLIALVAAIAMLIGAFGEWVYAVSFSRRVKSALAVAAPKLESKSPAAAPDAPTTATLAMNEPGGGGRGMRGPGRRGGSPEAAMAEMPEDMKKLLKEKYLFGRPRNEVSVTAILGDRALVNGNWMKVGDENEGVKLLELGQNHALVDIFGEEREVSVLAPLPGTPGSQGMGPGGQRGGNRDGMRGRGRRGSDGMGGPGSGMDREEMRERYRRMREQGGPSEEEMRRMREEFRSRRGGGGGGRRDRDRD